MRVSERADFAFFARDTLTTESEVVTSRPQDVHGVRNLRTTRRCGRDETLRADPVVGLRGFVAVDSVREGAQRCGCVAGRLVS